MSERGLPIADGAHACPFVAFDDDRDERSTVPDHRHRCYAEVRPAPRALAHQEAYCLSSAFPVCPTFQDWARRESARARDDAAAAAATRTAPVASGPVPPPVVAAGLAAAADAVDPEPADEEAPLPAGAMWAAAPVEEEPERTGRPEPEPERDAGPRRNPPREWSAPPPWLASAEAANRTTAGDPPDFAARRSQPGAGLAGSAADRLAAGEAEDVAEEFSRTERSASAAAPSAAAAAVPRRRPEIPADTPRRRAAPHTDDDDDALDADFEARDLPRPAPASRRPRAYDQHLGGPSGPDWERPRRYEAYPTIQTRIGIPQVPRLVYMAAAVGLLALALFFLPALLGLGSDEEARATPSPTAQPSRSAAPPTPTPAPTPILYVIKAGDTLSSIATANGLTLEQLLAANEDITNPNLITQGQQIIIPTAATPPPEQFGGSPSAGPAASP